LAALLLLLLLGLPACGDDDRSSSATGPDEIATIPIVVALGDSLTAGPGLAPDEAYPAVLQERLRAEGFRHRVINAGVSGDTSADALRRVDAALVEHTRVLIVALGANDGLQGAPVAEMKRNISAIIERAKERGIRVLLCGMETPPTRGWDYTVAFHRAFPELAVQHAVTLVPFLLTGVVGNPDFNLGDRIHPNAAGARRIAETIWPYLKPLLEESSRVLGFTGSASIAR
jgi:acyl-CoA thioesterase I